MDSIISLIRKTPADRADEQGKLNKKLYESEKVLKKHLGAITANLAELNPQTQTLGYMHLLAAKSETEIKNHGEYVEQARPLLQQGDPQLIVLAKDKFAAVCRQYAASILYTENPSRGLQPLRQAVETMTAIDNSPNLLTSVHADFAKLCLKTKMYSYALSVIETPYYQVKKETGMEVLDYLLYHYYSGLLFVGLKKFSKALESFQLVLTVQSASLSAIQVESFKRYVICCLIVHGELVPLPLKTTSPVVARSVDRICAMYIDFARAYKKGIDAAQRVIEQQVEDFRKDKTLGIVKQAVQTAVKRNILRLTNTYVTMSLADLVKMANLPSVSQAEQYLLIMIEEGTLFARINQKDGMVSFVEDPEEYDTTTMVEKMDAKIKEVVDVSKKLQEVDKAISVDQRYLRRTEKFSDDKSALDAAVAMSMMPGGGGGRGMEDTEMKLALEFSLHQQ